MNEYGTADEILSRLACWSGYSTASSSVVSRWHSCTPYLTHQLVGPCMHKSDWQIHRPRHDLSISLHYDAGRSLGEAVGRYCIVHGRGSFILLGRIADE